MMYMGIDTSAYITSLAIVDGDKQVIWEVRRILEVPLGERGLLQSETLFQHIINLPILVSKVPSNLWNKIEGIGVSVAPKNVEGSCMPASTAGYAVASALASSLRKRLVQTSHQEGHLAAGIELSSADIGENFLAVHLSGRTTELLEVKKEYPGKYDIELLGGTTDLHAGQFVDRVGVRLGLKFPSGKELEKLALKASPGSASLLPSSVKGYEVSFSEAEAVAKRLFEQNKGYANIARAVEGCIVRTVVKLLEKGIQDTGLTQVILVGGVASNKYIRSEIQKKLIKKAEVSWASQDWSTDNAIGIALLTRENCK